MSIQATNSTKLAMFPAGGATASRDTAKDTSFGKYLIEALDQVNDLQKKSDQASMDLTTGKLEDISQVVIAAEKAAVALQLTIQIRNKMLESYQEMMRMQV
jgi:flagellar hook-basal body complex protein FliE